MFRLQFLDGGQKKELHCLYFPCTLILYSHLVPFSSQTRVQKLFSKRKILAYTYTPLEDYHLPLVDLLLYSPRTQTLNLLRILTIHDYVWDRYSCRYFRCLTRTRVASLFGFKGMDRSSILFAIFSNKENSSNPQCY